MSGILDIETLRGLVAKATPGPWFSSCQNDALYLVSGRAPAMNNDYPRHDAPRVYLARIFGPAPDDCLPVNADANAALIVYLVNSIPAIEAMAERVRVVAEVFHDDPRAAIDEARAALNPKGDV